MADDPALLMLQAAQTDQGGSAGPSAGPSANDTALQMLQASQQPEANSQAAPPRPHPLRMQTQAQHPAGHPTIPPRPAAAPELSWGQVASQGAGNLVPSIVHNAVDMVSPFLPQNWGNTARGAVSLARGVAAKTGIIDQNSEANRTRDSAPIDAAVAAYRQKYSNNHVIRQTLANDPASYLADIAAVASLAAGGEGIMARAPGVVGDVARAGNVARVANTVERFTNPVSLTARAAASVLPRVSVNAGRVGGLTNRVLRMAVPAGRLSAADVAADPAFASALQRTMQRRGISPASAREGILHRFDDAADGSSPVATPVVTRTAASPNVASAVADNIGQWKGRVANAVSGMAGDAHADFGSELEGAQIAAHNGYVHNYNTVAQNPGAFHPSFAQTLPNALSQSLAAMNLPSMSRLARFPHYSTTAEALRWLVPHVNNLATHGALTPQELMEVRKGLGNFWQQARGPDEAGVGALINGFDSHIQTEAAAGRFNGDAAAVARQMPAAIDSFRQYKQAFSNNTNPTHGTVARAVKNFMPDQAKDVSGMITSPAPPGSSTAAQGSLASGLVNPRNLTVPPGAEKLYGKLVEVMGGPNSSGAQALRAHIRQTVGRTVLDGRGNLSLAATPDQIHTFLTGPLAGVFTQREQSMLRQAAEAQRMLTLPPLKGAAQEKIINQVGAHALRTAGSAVAGHVLGGPFGGVLGAAAEMGVEPLLAARTAGNALKGAPKSNPLWYGPRRAAPGSANKPQSPVAGTFNNVQEDENPPEESGGYSGGAGKMDPDASAALKNVAPTTSDADAATRMLIAEAGNQPPEGQLAALYTAINRAKESGKTLAEEIARPYAYTAVTQGHANATPDSPVYQRILNEVVAPALAGELEDPTGGMTHYLNPELFRKLYPHKAIPAWAQGEGKRIGDHVFYRAEGGRTQRASGGKVTSEVRPHLARLLSAVERAKRAETAATKPLLHTPDSAVARALEVANRGI